MNNFYTSLIGMCVANNSGNIRKIIAAWLGPNNNVRTLVVGLTYGEMFLLDLPDPQWTICDRPI